MVIDVQFTEPPTYNDRIRLDRQGLTPEQATREVYHGAYRDGRSGGGEGEMVSPLYPLLQDGLEQRLVQSQCYWTARRPNRGGDLVAATWEVLVAVTRESAFLSCRSPRYFGSCRFRHPETGQPVIFRDPGAEFEGCPDEPATGETLDLDVALLPHSIALPGEEIEATVGIFTDDLVVYTQEVSMVRAAPDPDRLCPGSAAQFQPFTGVADPLDFRGGELGCGQQEGFHSSCGKRCIVEPTGDGTLQMSLPGVPPHPVRPNLQVVDGDATLRRVMGAVGGGGLTYAWSTGVDGQPPEVRWHENFSPRTSVRWARLYQRLPNGTEQALELGDEPRLVLAATYPGPATPVSEVWSCRGTEDGDALLVPLFGVEGVACDGPGTGDALAVTPTYVRAHLEEAAGLLTQPLSWQVTLAEPPLPGAGVVLELQVHAELAGAALRVSPLVDLGAAEPGQRRYGSALLQNVGGQVMRVDDLHLDGADAGDFTFRLPAETKPVSLPVRIDLSRPKGLSAGIPFLSEPLAWSLPPLRQVRSSELGGHLRIRTPLEDGARVEYLDSELTVEGDRLLFEDPSADFTLAAETGEHFPVAVVAHDAFADRSVPFTLLPGESVEILVSGSPGGYGERVGRLVVEGVPVAAPAEHHEVVSTLVLEGRTGALLELFPGTPQHFPTGRPDRPSYQRNLLLVNSGDTTGRRRDVDLVGDGAAFFAVVSTNPPQADVGPGESEMFTVEYRPTCFPLPLVAPGEPWQRRAVLRVATDAGDFEVVLVGAYEAGCGGSP